ncbi:MAG TPA: 3-oxoacid CoA-transferase subunit A [Acidimicrobiales bacterium]|nr:3-oxoacid CoA-transferase subunit A [Acidimicrobiales bacterium]
MNKIRPTPAEAIADIADGASIAIAGFGVAHRFPSSLIIALAEQGTRDLCIYCNGLGQPGHPTAHLLAENHQIGKLVAAFSARPGVVSEAEKQILAGELELEIVPQGTLVERMRAGAAGLAGFYTPTAAGTVLAAGKETREFDGITYVLERALRPDYAFVRGYRGDALGNVQLRGGSRNFNVSFAKAARVSIAEVDEIVAVGEIPPDDVDLPGVFVSRVVKSTTQMDVRNLPMRESRPASSARSYLGRPGLSRDEIARRAALLLEEHSYVNLGAGLPNLVANHLAGRDIVLHSENGILGYGERIEGEDFDPDVHDAGGWFVSTLPGASFFESVTSFEIARSGRLGAVRARGLPGVPQRRLRQLGDRRDGRRGSRRGDGSRRRGPQRRDHDGAPRQRRTAQAGRVVLLSPHRSGTCRLRRHRPRPLPQGRRYVAPRRGGAGVRRRGGALAQRDAPGARRADRRDAGRVRAVSGATRSRAPRRSRQDELGRESGWR